MSRAPTAGSDANATASADDPGVETDAAGGGGGDDVPGAGAGTESDVAPAADSDATSTDDATTEATLDSHATNRWRGVVALALASGAVGLFAESSLLVFLSAVGIVFATYPQLASAPDPAVEIEWTVATTAPQDGERVAVEVAVRNVGDRTLPDVRVVDGVPPALSVVDGTPRHATALRPGQRDTFAYEVVARPGTHGFEPATVTARDVSGAHEVETTVDHEADIDCRAGVAGAPLRAQTIEHAGRIVADQRGSGVAFDSTREYRRGDPTSRIDWKGYARTNELVTVEYRQEQAATVAVLVDARRAAYRGRAGEPHAVVAGAAAAEELFVSLLDDRNQVGVAGIGRDLAWLAPGSGREHRARGRRLLATHETFGSRPPRSDAVAASAGESDGAPTADHDAQLRTLRSQLPGRAQVLLVTPLADDEIVTAARTLEAHGHPVTVVSPDVTTDRSAGQRVAGVERDNRVGALRNAGLPVVEWEPGDPLALALSDTARWSR